MGQGQSDEEKAPEPGDMVEFSRGLYYHYGVAVDKKYVVHFTSPDTRHSGLNISSVGGSKGEVKKERLSDVAGQNKYRVNNKYDKKWKPRDPKDIVCDAEAMVGQEMDYNLLYANCEHFATKLRYGVAACKQADYAIMGGTAAIAVGGLGGLVAVIRAIVGAVQDRQKNIRPSASELQRDLRMPGDGFSSQDISMPSINPNHPLVSRPHHRNVLKLERAVE
ncbi:phospholipase A and acyltransferase 3-like [Anolis sagrei]|uniref:phospholipase A and acyltransferase 3-like n=1 Tax=Anolis sagrei TaxID=38937 RepID=UPI003522C518